MLFSIIIPSFNQAKYIRATLENVVELKSEAAKRDFGVEILLLDNNSNEQVQRVINDFKSELDSVIIEKDSGQYDAINKGILKCKGDYWTWLNTDDTILTQGFLKLAEIVQNNYSIDYIYGDIRFINESGIYLRTVKAISLEKNTLVNKNPGIYQPGSFFKSTFTKQIGLLKKYDCCFDYEYVLRCITNNANIYKCDFAVANFRLHTDSKSRSIVPVFISEQIQISKNYGRKLFSFLTWFLYLRLAKHKILPRK